jgi:hypothetical protein
MMKCRPILGRSVHVDDLIMNEWTQTQMKVVEVEIRQSLNPRGRSHKEVALHCVKADGGHETIYGNYWHGKTWLVKRGQDGKS